MKLRTTGSAQNTTGTIFGKVTGIKGDIVTIDMAGKTLHLLKTDAIAIPKTELVELQNAVEKVKAPSKKSQAVTIFNDMKGAAPKDIKEQFMTMVGLSKAGSNTYYQNIQSGQWS